MDLNALWGRLQDTASGVFIARLSQTSEPSGAQVQDSGSHLGNVGPGITASPAGRTILYSRVDSSVDDLMLVENFR